MVEIQAVDLISEQQKNESTILTAPVLELKQKSQRSSHISEVTDVEILKGDQKTKIVRGLGLGGCDC